MDPLRLAIAAVPVAAYLVVVGIVNLRRRPLLASGSADLAAVGIAISGLVFVGPIELFRPQAATADLGDAVWVLMLGLYALPYMLFVLISRPRLVVYNMTAEQLRPLLAEAVAEVDPDARWAGDSLKLPRLGVQLHLDVFGPMRHTSLVSSGGDQSLDGWQRLRKALARALAGTTVSPHPRGVSLLITAALLLLASVTRMAADPKQVAQAISDLLSF